MSRTDQPKAAISASTWMVLFCAATIVTIAMGIRQSFGLFLRPVELDIGVGRELTRHRVGMSFCQESTRYCNYSKERLGGSLAAHLLALQRGAAIIRAHDVAETVQALRVARAIEDKQ